MSEQPNNPVEKKTESSAIVEDIMADTQELGPTPEQRAEMPEQAKTTEVPMVEEAVVAKAAKTEYGPRDVVAAGEKDPELMQVERKLEDRELWKVYAGLKPKQRERFKQAGEALAVRFRGMLGRADVDPLDVFVPIDKWLSDVPGIIHPYVMQAAKNKSDNVLELIREYAATVQTEL